MKPAHPSSLVKLSSKHTGEFWPVPILREDDALFAIDKPPGLLVSPDRYDRERPNIMALLHQEIARNAPWTAEHQITYLSNVHRLDFDTSGVLLLAKTKPALVALASQFGNEKPTKTYLTLVSGVPDDDEFTVDVRLAPDPRALGRMRWSRDGKKSITRFHVLERFRNAAFVSCHPLTGRTHQIRVHLLHAGFPILGDPFYGNRTLFLSHIKSSYKPKSHASERPLTPRLALHASTLEVEHPGSLQKIRIHAPLPKDIEVALKYLRKFSAPRTSFQSLA